MKHAVNLGIIGVGGFAKSHLASIRRCEEKGECRLAAAVIRNPDKKDYLDTEQELRKQNVSIYRDYKTMFAKEGDTVDCMIIPCGIDQHEELTVRACEAGFHVMCEKPVAGTIAEAVHMRDAVRSTDSICAIGFQDIFSPSIQKIKRIAIDKTLGNLLGARTYALWPRISAYYKRNDWAGRLYANKKFIFDSPMQNATAHFLNAMLYVAGEEPHKSANPEKVYGECYRAQDIESSDTQYIRVHTDTGVCIEFTVTHATSDHEGPHAVYQFEKGSITWEMGGTAYVYEKRPDGDAIVTESFDNQGENIHDNVFLDTIDAIRNQRQPLCNIENALQHTRCIENLYKSSGGIHQIPQRYLSHLQVTEEAYNLDSSVDMSREYNTVIRDVEKVILDMFEEGKSFYEAGVEWSVTTREISM